MRSTIQVFLLILLQLLYFCHEDFYLIKKYFLIVFLSMHIPFIMSLIFTKPSSFLINSLEEIDKTFANRSANPYLSS